MVNDTKMVANITVNNCAMYSGNQTVAPAAAPSYPSPAPTPVQQQPSIPRQRTPEELSSVSERIKQANRQIKETEEEVDFMMPSAEEEESPEEKKVIVPLKKVCGNCEQETIVEAQCNGCGTPICDGCGVESAEDGKSYCEPCWNKL